MHREIGRDFVDSTQPILGTHERLSNRAVSTILRQRPGSTTPSLGYYLVRPDLIDLTDQELYEIKTVNQKKQGASDLRFYIDSLNAHDPGWSEGTLYEPPSTMLVPGVGRIIIEAPTSHGSGYPGVVAYEKDGNNSSDVTGAIVTTIELAIAAYLAYLALRAGTGALAPI